MTTTHEAPLQQAGPPWTRCAGCGILHYAKKLARTLGVCPDCGHHHRLTAAERIAQLVDADSFVPLGIGVTTTDVLRFTDSQPYASRLVKARAATGMEDAVVAGTARIGDRPLALAVMDFRFMGGSLGAAVGELITLAADTALRQCMPLLLVTASGGARMQEGVIALMQMAKVSQALATLRDAGLLSVSLVTDPTYGGVAASFATNCDVIVMEHGARMGFAGPRVIEQTIREQLPPDFQTADYDSLLAKVIVWAPDREQAIDRMDRCLAEFAVDGRGVRTTIPFLRRVLADAEFRKAAHCTALVDRIRDTTKENDK